MTECEHTMNTNQYCWLYRGYGDTEKPAHKKDYKIETLTQDIAELIPALGYKSCVLVAHDWGGLLAWYVHNQHTNIF